LKRRRRSLQRATERKSYSHRHERRRLLKGGNWNLLESPEKMERVRGGEIEKWGGREGEKGERESGGK
jgi:hypothetical protein